MAASDLDTPTGRLRVTGDGAALIRVTWLEPTDPPSDPQDGDDVSRETVRQLLAYFDRSRTTFDLPLAPAGGSPFERAVWEAMRAIPYGETWTYGDLAARLGGVARAVGGACGRNPIPIVIPCHRVLGAGGKLVGFSGGSGIDSKARLLDLERGQASLF